MTDASTTREFLREFSKHSRRIYGFIRALVHNQADADELYQDVCTILWEKFAEFRRGSDFRAWAFQIAHYRVLSFRQRKRNRPHPFSDAFIDVVEADLASTEVSDRLDARFRALAECYAKLPRTDQDLIDRRYLRGASVKEIAAQTRKGVDYVYKAIRRIHAVLFDCVTGQVADDPTAEEAGP
jgi:RNA polymerase sigma-70 factor (ECF subfamily)